MEVLHISDRKFNLPTSIGFYDQSFSVSKAATGIANTFFKFWYQVKKFYIEEF